MVTVEQRETCLESLESFLEIDCRSGLYDEPNIREAINETIHSELGEADDELEARAVRFMTDRLREHALLETTWTERTANDRLDDALRDLESRGFVVGQALGSTLQEGLFHLDGLAEGRDPSDLRGYVFYHRQDLERALRGEGLMLAFGGWGTDAREDSRAVGEEIVHVLSHHAVSCEWDRSAGTRIEVLPFEWRRRRTTTAPKGLPPAPPLPVKPNAPPRCPFCKGKGFITKSIHDFPELCVCKGGKAKAAQGDPFKQTAHEEPSPAPSEARGKTNEGVGERIFAPEIPPFWHTLLLAVALAGATALFARWKALPWLGAIGAAAIGFVLPVVKRARAIYDTLEIDEKGVRCRSSKREWALSFKEIFRVYRTEDRWIFETHPPHVRHTFDLDGHEAHRAELRDELSRRTKMLNLQWALSLTDLL